MQGVCVIIWNARTLGFSILWGFQVYQDSAIEMFLSIFRILDVYKSKTEKRWIFISIVFLHRCNWNKIFSQVFSTKILSSVNIIRNFIIKTFSYSKVQSSTFFSISLSFSSLDFFLECVYLKNVDSDRTFYILKFSIFKCVFLSCHLFMYYVTYKFCRN